MLIAHLPVGYIFFRATNQKPIFSKESKKSHLFGILLGSVLPDVDTFWFYFISDRSEVHHSYWTHTPFFWTFVCVFVYTFSKITKVQSLRVFNLGLWMSLMLHLGLDTIAGQIRWAWPFSNQAIQLVDIPPTHSWWVMSFIFHWTFFLEIGLILIALLLFLKDRSRSI